MASKDRSGAAWPDVPPSLNHESVEMASLGKEQLLPHADTAPGVTPYLGLRARLSQIWLNRWTILLLLVLVRVLLRIGSLNDNIGDAKVKALSSCTKVEDIGSAMASMPHYLSVGVNSLAADGINKAISAMVEVLMMILTGVEALILFVINMYVGTYACLIAAFIHGGLDVGVSAVEGATDFMNNAIDKITQSISDDVGKIQNAINSAFSTISSSASIFGANIDPPKIDITGHLDDLKNIQVDDTKFVQDLIQLNKTIPTFDQVKNFTEHAISIPFDLVKTQLNNSRSGWAFDKSIFPVAEKQALSFCSDNSFIRDFFQSMFELIAKAKITFIVVLSILAVAACIPMAYLEIRRWRRQQRDAYVFTKYGYDPMDVIYIVSRPFTAICGIKASSRFSGRRQVLVRWAIAYATSFPALFVLSLAIAGFFSCLCQYILLRAIQKEAPALASQVGNFAEDVVTTLQGVSVRWANDANGVVGHFNDEINNDVLGYVVNATAAVNDTLNTFETEMNDALDTVFKGTVLYNVVKGVIHCLIGIKIDSVQKGLTWVHDHARIDLPLFPNDTFSQGASNSIQGDSELTSFLATPASVTTDEITGAVEHVTDMLHSGIVQEAIISTALLLIWIIIILIGLCRALAGMAAPNRTRAEGGQRYAMTTADPTTATTGTAAVAGGPVRTRFPQFGGGGAASATADDFEARAARDEKLAAGGVRGGKAGGLRSPGYWRGSSYGHVEDAGR
ncbi:putative plasma membrane fusion protein prm1 protein [Phialemonium atrogriseum]|uniref:Plasma membrane fusion protein PRM1 n=1 Tax=Phialemonium atrogriseum TaxID=1093897 RepID=A0AAJ0CB27_9PEZI|nr:putative plasma membrane fusion protein prm1 protein [Phialemonium atrogriseum]KAK1772832.1 putative plasma membrane fusion protein prm1 protein [Phialemonium atrogriseum]